ncbi:MAG: hypothetical protein GPJ54_19025 [Candidatus Heimdallarchaeota archaeon]|nr:hypothetical protein [Candidatus Heimdallarchaeota archaeon]
MAVSGYSISDLYANPDNEIILDHGSITWTSSYIRFNYLYAQQYPGSGGDDPVTVGYKLWEGFPGDICGLADAQYWEANSDGGSHTMNSSYTVYNIDSNSLYSAVFFATYIDGLQRGMIAYLSLLIWPTSSSVMEIDGTDLCSI